MIKADAEATKTRKFLDWRSYVAPDGREVLYGEDWEARKQEVWERSKWMCEGWDANCYVKCREPMLDAHHIIKRSVRRDDRMDNLAGLCRTHHQRMHAQTRWYEKKNAISK
jgi:hypothetical protein